MIIVLILVGLIIDLGGAPNHERLGFRVSVRRFKIPNLSSSSFQYWKNPGAVAGAGLEPKHVGLDRFLGILSVIVQAAFSFQGIELVAM